MKISLCGDQQAEDAIADWYHDCITREVEEHGFSIKQDFSFVQCIDVDEQCKVRPFGRIFQDYVQYDPYDTILFIFYARDLYNKSIIHLQCEALWKDLHQRNGVLPCNAPVTGNFCIPDLEPVQAATNNGPMFYFPFLCDEKKRELSHHRAVLHDVLAYCDWVFGLEGCNVQKERIPPQRLVGVQHILYLLAPFPLWDNALDAKEYEFLSSQLQHASEQHVLRLIAYNYPRQKMAAFMVKPSPLALWHFMQRWPNKAKPNWLLSVPMEQMPKEVQTAFPIRPGGKLEIAYADVLLWLQFTRNQLKYKMQTNVVTRPPPEHSPLYGMLQEIQNHIKHRLGPAALPQGNAKGGSSSKQCSKAALQAPADMPLGDLEDLVNILPPCMLSFCNAVRFPRHKERMDQTKAFKAAGVSLDMVARFYEHYNNTYPHNEGHIADVSKRFKYDYYYERATQPMYCKTIIRQTLDGETDCMQCPYATKEGAINLDDACGKAKLQCAKQNLEGMPYFNGPHKVMMLKQNK